MVTGATGNVGSELVRQLLAAGHNVRAFVKNEDAAKRLPTGQITPVVGDYAQVATLAAAMQGADAVYALTPVAEQAKTWMFNIIDAAKQTKVGHVVKHSAYGMRPGDAQSIALEHSLGDEYLIQSGLSYTILQPNSYMQNMLWQAEAIKQSGTVYMPLGDAKQSVVDLADIAAVAVKTLTEPGHNKQTYVLTGPQSLSVDEQLAIISGLIHKPLTYVAVPPEAAEQAMKESGMPAWNAHAMAVFMKAIGTGAFAATTGDVKKILGREPVSYSAFVQRYLAAFR